MKRIIFSILAVFLVVQVYASNITDPFFMPGKRTFVSDTSINFTNNALRLGKSWGFGEVITYGLEDNLSLSLGLGWAKIKHAKSGLQDPVFAARYRLVEEAAGGLMLDVKGYLSPSIFNSPLNNDGGAAKGSFDTGAALIVGSREWFANTLLWAEGSLDYIGSTDLTKSGTALGLALNAKYYMDESNSLGAGLFTKGYFGFGDNFNGFGIKFDYARLLQDNIALIPYLSFESHNKNISTEVKYGLTARITF